MPRALALFVPRAKYHACCHVASQLSHPNILAIFDIGTFEGAPYIVSELVEGETLRRRLADGPLPLRAAVELAGQVPQSWRRRTGRASSTATSSRRTCSSPVMAGSRSWTSAW